jgi:hypothetical protein
MDLLQKDVPILTKIYEAKCFYDSQNNRIILYYKNRVTGQTLVDFYNLQTTPPLNSSLYVIYNLQNGTFNVSTNPPTYTVSNSKVYVTSPINAEYDMDKVIIYRIDWYENTDSGYTLTQLDTFRNQLDTFRNQLDTFRNQLDTFVRREELDTLSGNITQLDTFVRTQIDTLSNNITQLDNFVRTQQADIRTQLDTFVRREELDTIVSNQLNTIVSNQLETIVRNQLNTIIPLNADGALDLSQAYIRSSVYTFRRVDLTNATSDYNLQLGEEAYYVWNTNTSLLLPLRIAVSGLLYQLIVLVPRTSSGIYLFLHPNNTTYTSAFQRTAIYPSGSNEAVYNWKINISVMFYEQVGGGGMLVSLLQTMTTNKGEMHFITAQHTALGFSLYTVGSHRWNDTSTVWSSLGTLRIENSNGTLIVLVRRLL